MQRPLKIGTRGSPLALYQARLVQSRLASHHGISGQDVDEAFPICIFKTSGDKLKGDLAEFGGKGLFTKELEEALLSCDVDMAVHSMKDVPTQGQDALTIGAVLEREDPRDAFISVKYDSIAELPQGAVLGTASLRRRAQLAAMRPDVRFVLLRGNVGTRLNKLKAGECDATFLAYAGLKRLGRTDVVTQIIESVAMLNAPAQAAIGIEVRQDDTEALSAISDINHPNTELAITAERAFLRALDGSCRTPIAALARIKDTTLAFRGQVLSTDGQLSFERSTELTLSRDSTAYDVGYDLGMSIRAEIGDRNIWDG